MTMDFIITKSDEIKYDLNDADKIKLLEQRIERLEDTVKTLQDRILTVATYSGAY
jgi:hypothetical protein